MKINLTHIFIALTLFSLSSCTGGKAPASPTTEPIPPIDLSPSPIRTNTPLSVNTPWPVRSKTATQLPSANSALQASPSTTELEQAVMALQHIEDPENLEDEKKKALDDAFNVLGNAGAEGTRLLKEKLVAMQKAGESDIHFQLLAAWLLWKIGGLDEVDSIVDIWTSIPPEDWYYYYLFMPGMSAASTQDTRALPMLEVLLADKKGKPYTLLEFPLTHEFLWGTFGSKGLPALLETLQAAKNPTEIESAINLLARAQYLPALPEIRKQLNNQDPDIRSAAILALGQFGHPDDFDLLISGLSSKDPNLLKMYIYSLVEFGDERAVPQLIPFLQVTEQRREVAWGLGNYLASPAGLSALKDAAAKTTEKDWAKECDSYIQGVLDSADLTWDVFKDLSDLEQQEVTDGFRYSGIRIKPGEKAITHDQLIEVVAEWQDTGRITSEKWEWVETRHILPIATPEDINLLLDGKAKFYLRLSDECISDARIVDDLIKWIGRSRYREIGLIE